MPTFQQIKKACFFPIKANFRTIIYANNPKPSLLNQCLLRLHTICSTNLSFTKPMSTLFAWFKAEKMGTKPTARFCTVIHKVWFYFQRDLWRWVIWSSGDEPKTGDGLWYLKVPSAALPRSTTAIHCKDCRDWATDSWQKVTTYSSSQPVRGEISSLTLSFSNPSHSTKI